MRDSNAPQDPVSSGIPDRDSRRESRRVSGRVALVTGGAGGLGEAIGHQLACAGAGVVLADVRGDGARQAARRVGAHPIRGAVTSTELDVTDPESWAAAVRLARRRFGAPDLLVNNAGVVSVHAVESVPDEEWRHVVEVCQRGVWLGIRSLLPAMRSRGGGAVVNVGSVFGRTGSPTSFAYHAAKGAVRSMTQAAAVQLADQGVRVNSVAPGLIRTGMTDSLPPSYLERIVDNTPLRRFGTPEDVARAVVFLASAEASFITGVELAVDGGFAACGPGPMHNT